MHHQPKKIVLGLLLAILVVAFALRITNIENIPAGLFADEAENGIDALKANTTGEYKLFYESNQGREGLFINIQAISVKYLGNNIFALKLPSIIFGTLTVLGTFLLIYELFYSYIAALVGAYLIAFSYWAINFSRIGFRAIMVPFILVFAFYFIFRGLRTKKFHDFVIAGFIYGLGLHTYIAFRVSPLVLITLLIALIITRQNFIKEYWKHIFVFAFFMFVASTPMLLDFFYFHPEHYASRTSHISILNPEVNHGHLASLLTKTIGLSIQKYFAVGDFNMRHNYPPYPLLNPIVGFSFLIGLIFVVGKFFHLLYIRFKKGIRDEKLVSHSFLIVWFLVLLIPEFLAYEGNPHALRAIGTLPVVIIIAMIPIMWIINKYNTFGHSFNILAVSILIAFFAFIGLADPIKYFVFFAKNPKQMDAFDENLKTISQYINSLPASTVKYLVASEYSSRPIKFLSAKTENIFYTWPCHIKHINPTNNNFVILIANSDPAILSEIKKMFPDLKMKEYRKSEKNFYIELKP
jgi:4-amino-4-deoxy-L-arabinose transferase-like glycosyltransferase